MFDSHGCVHENGINSGGGVRRRLPVRGRRLDRRPRLEDGVEQLRERLELGLRLEEEAFIFWTVESCLEKILNALGLPEESSKSARASSSSTY